MEITAKLNAREVIIGHNVEIAPDVEITAIGGPAERIEIGDNVRIGAGVRLLVPRVRIGDYTAIHPGVTANGYSELAIGSCSWIGQQAFLNATGPLTIGNGVIFGPYSSAWTHLAGGDVLQGFRFLRQSEFSLGDDSYVAPQCFFSPGKVGARVMVLAASVITRDVPDDRIVGGNPAADLTDKLGAPFAEVPVEVRYQTLCRILGSFRDGEVRKTMVFRLHEGAPIAAEPTYRQGGITLTMVDCPEDGSSIFDVRDRTYSKLRTPEELAFMRYLIPHAKFYPRPANTIG